MNKTNTLLFSFLLSLTLGCSSENNDEVENKHSKQVTTIENKIKTDTTSTENKESTANFKVTTVKNNNSILSGTATTDDTKRITFVRNNGIPADYKNLTAPSPQEIEKVLSEGAKLYKSKCSVCHGKEAKGDGLAGKNLKPPASNLNKLIKLELISFDSYLYWTLTEGGKPIKTSMPSFKSSLSEEQRWLLVNYLQNNFKQSN